MLEKGDLYRGRLFIGKIKKWDMFMHWEFTRIQVRYSWTGVEGLSLNLWNMETFRKIGDACGGLLDIAPETKNQTFFMYAMLKVKGFSTGFMHPIAAIPCDKETVHVGLFSLGPYPLKGQVRFGSTRGLLARSVEGGLCYQSQSNNNEDRAIGVEADGRC